MIGRLPAELCSSLDEVAVILEVKPDPRRSDSDLEEDTLGVFIGSSIRENGNGAPLPPRIILFLENIREEGRESGRGFRGELRRTFLHELGHYLGLEEEDLAVRDVD